MSANAAVTTLWDRVKSDLQNLFPEDVYNLWFEPMVCLEGSETEVTLGVSTDFAAIWINDNYAPLISERFVLNAGHPIKVNLRKNNSPSTTTNRLPRQEAPAVRAEPARTTRRTASASMRKEATGLLPHNTFENYVVGANNDMAHAAALAVSQAPGEAYSPLFLYGDTGLGKTHLMHAIGHAILKADPGKRVAYLSAEKFTNDYVQAIREQSFTKFRQHYRQVDVLIIDDVQFLGGKESVQEEFFHTFNDLHNHGKQIVLSSDRRATEINKLEERLVSRFSWGLVTDIQAPNYETRLAILRNKAAGLNFDIPADVAEFIARNISKNIRSLEGALLKIASYSTLTKKAVTLPLAEELLKDAIVEQAKNQLTIDGIQKMVCDHYQISRSDMLSKRRPQNIAFPRQIAMYLSRILTKHSLQEIGECFGGRDHGTVIHACKTVENIMEQDVPTRGSIEFIKQQLSK